MNDHFSLEELVKTNFLEKNKINKTPYVRLINGVKQHNTYIKIDVSENFSFIHKGSVDNVADVIYELFSDYKAKVTVDLLFKPRYKQSGKIDEEVVSIEVDQNGFKLDDHGDTFTKFNIGVYQELFIYIVIDIDNKEFQRFKVCDFHNYQMLFS